MVTASKPWDDRVHRELQTWWMRLQNPSAFNDVWTKLFDDDDRIAVGDDPERFRRSLTVGLLQERYGWSEARAVVEGSRMFGMSERDYRWLLREIGDAGAVYDLEEDRAIRMFDLVIVATSARRAAHWRTELFTTRWSHFGKPWEYFVTVARKSERGLEAKAADFGLDDRDHSRSLMSHWKYRLVRLAGFPKELAEAFKVQENAHRIDIDRSRICVLVEGVNGKTVRLESST